MDQKILLQNLADSLAERTGITKKKAETFVRSFFELTEEGLLSDGLVKVKNYGTTKVVKVSDRESVNINTGERFQIEGHAKVSFTPDALFRDIVNQPFAQFTTIILDDDIDEAELNAASALLASDEEPLAVEESNSEDEEPADVLPSEEQNEEDATLEPAAPEEPEEPAAPEEPEEPAAPEEPEEPTAPEEPEEPTAPEEPEEPTAPEEPEEPTAPEEPEEPEEPTAPEEHEPSEELQEDTANAEPLISEIPESEDNIEQIEVIEPKLEETTEAAAQKIMDQANHPEDMNSPIIINNTLPTPRHNWWRTAFIVLMMMVLMLASYFAGYFRIFCPCIFDDVTNDSSTVVEKPAAPAPAAPTANPAATADSAAKAPAAQAEQDAKNTTAPAPQEQAQKLTENKVNEKAISTKPAQKKVAPKKTADKEPVQNTAVKRAAQRREELQAAQNYQQIAGANYLITGVMQTRYVRPGENLYKIAREVYGHKDFARYISFYNNIEDPNLVTIGQKIQLPRLTKK